MMLKTHWVLSVKKNKTTYVKEYTGCPIFINLLAVFFIIQEEEKKEKV